MVSRTGHKCNASCRCDNVRRLILGKFAAVVLAVCAGVTACGGQKSLSDGQWKYTADDGYVWWNVDSQTASVNQERKLAVECSLGYENSTSERTFEFWVKYGIIGDSTTNCVLLKSESKAGADYVFWDPESEPINYRALSIPGFSPVPYIPFQLWFQVVYSNTTYQGTSPVPASNDLTTETDVYTVNGVWTGTDLDNHPKCKVVTGLGENHDEVAVVFNESATWTAPRALTNVKFLVVGGGGGGGGDSSSSTATQGGGGGGGGGVVTGIVYSVAKNAEIAVSVGAGGAGGAAGSTANGTAGAAVIGSASYFEIDGLKYVTANGGGRDLGKSKQGGYGGSCAGCRPSMSSPTASYVPSKGSVGAGAESLLSAVPFGNKGGTSSYSYAAGGGGGAASEGSPAQSQSKGGNGGEGITNSITGTAIVYGSGGGGGAAGSSRLGGTGGTGAGRGNTTSTNSSNKNPGGNGAANQGGGGGGAGTRSNGGSGGSGIVVLRFALDTSTVLVPEIASRQYTGETLTADVEASDAYTVDQNLGGIDVGTYDVVLSLAAGFHWDDDQLADTITLPFAITIATNAWTTEPAISKASWTHGAEEAGVLTAGATRFGAVAATIAKDGGAAVAFDGTLPTAAGEYVITYTAPAATANYTAPETTVKTVSFAIYAADAIPPYEISLGTLSVGTDRVLSIPYSFSCDVTTAKTADLYARYAIDGETTTNTAQIATGVALDGGTGTGTIADLKPGAIYWVDVYAVVDEETSAPTTLQSVTVPGPATDFTAKATFTPIPMEFVIVGSVTPGLGTTTVTVEWSINNAQSFDESATFTFAPGDEGAFSTNIAHAALSDALTWRVSVENTVTTSTWGEQTFNDAAPIGDTTLCKDTGRVTYTWTGLGGNNLWTNVLNWSGTNMTKHSEECYGYPGLKFSYYWDTVIFTNDAVVDLCGGTYGLRDLDEGVTANIRFSKNINVNLLNGTIDINDSPYTIGANGTTVTFNGCKLIRETTSGTPDIGFATGSTIIFAGTTTSNWRWKTKANSTVIFRDGTTSTRYNAPSAGTPTSVTISNAVWSVTNGNIDNGIGTIAYFRDGPDRQAQFKTGTSQQIDLRYTYDIVIPASGHSLPTIQAGYLKSDTNIGTFKVNVSKYLKTTRVPLVKFSTTDSTYKGNNNTRVQSQIDNGHLKLQAIADGRDVTKKRTARLEWDSGTQTIYYAQDYSGATIIFLQ